MLATQRLEDATPVAERRANKTPPVKLRKEFYLQLVAVRLGDLTLDERAEAFGMGRATLARIEAGTIEPLLHKAMVMARRLDATVESLWATNDMAA